MYKSICYLVASLLSPRAGRWFVVLFLLGLPVFSFGKSAVTTKQIEIGRRIYQEGLRATNKPVQAIRSNSETIKGAEAACETCHRRSGMGSLEGNIVVPPITGRFLFASAENRAFALVDARAPKNITKAHLPYNDKSLNELLQKGVRNDGKSLSPLMPRYNFSKQEISALSRYLKQLSDELPDGVGTDTLTFATIITPEIDKVEREALTGMMQAAFNQRNASQQDYSGKMKMPIDVLPRTLRNWQLKVWALQGSPDTWSNQLAKFYKAEPVFAVVSGISKSNWSPVHDFCQRQKLPCLLPSNYLPPNKNEFYALYYSRGVMLEADVLAKYIPGLTVAVPQRLIQISRDNTPGRVAALQLAESLKDARLKVENRNFTLEDYGLKEILQGIDTNDAIALWLNSADLAALLNFPLSVAT